MARKRVRATNTISATKVEEMFRAYQENPTAKGVSEACNVNWRTADRYINRGDPDRGIQPFSKRLAKIEDQARKETDRSVLKAQKENITMVTSYKQKLVKALSKREIKPEEVDSAELDRFIRLEAFVLGEVESRTEEVHTVRVEQPKQITDDTLKRMAALALNDIQTQDEPIEAEAVVVEDGDDA